VNVLTSASEMVLKFIELHYVGWTNSSHPSWIAYYISLADVKASSIWEQKSPLCPELNRALENSLPDDLMHTTTIYRFTYLYIPVHIPVVPCESKYRFTYLLYLESQKHDTLTYAKCWQIFKILSPADSINQVYYFSSTLQARFHN